MSKFDIIRNFELIKDIDYKLVKSIINFYFYSIANNTEIKITYDINELISIIENYNDGIIIIKDDITSNKIEYIKFKDNKILKYKRNRKLKSILK